MAYVYILQSRSSSRDYVGSTSDLERRLAEHHRAHSLATRGRGPWVLVYQEEFPTLREARQQLGYLWFESLKIYYYAEDPRAALEQLRTALDTDITLDEFRRHIQPARQAEWEWAVEQIGRAVAVLQKEHYGMPDELRVKARAVRVLMSANGEKPGLTAIARVISMNSI